MEIITRQQLIDDRAEMTANLLSRNKPLPIYFETEPISLQCDECGDECECVVQVGQSSYTSPDTSAIVCSSCLNKAVEMVKGERVS